jgi:hypothetical protein
VYSSAVRRERDISLFVSMSVHLPGVARKVKPGFVVQFFLFFFNNSVYSACFERDIF